MDFLDVNIPLLPSHASAYLEDAKNSQQKKYLKAVSVRNCLECIMDTVFVYLKEENCTENERKKWIKLKLFKKIESLSSFFPNDILNQIHDIRKLGNKGAHQGGHKDLNTSDINSAIKVLSEICEWTILQYFKKYGFDTQPWVPTIFSTLPPMYRQRILEDLFKDDKSLLLADKLAMVYLKGGDYNKSISFLKRCHDENIIDSAFMYQMIEKMDILKLQINRLPIAKSLENTSINLREIIKSVEDKDISMFIILFSSIVAPELMKE